VNYQETSYQFSPETAEIKSYTTMLTNKRYENMATMVLKELPPALELLIL